VRELKRHRNPDWRSWQPVAPRVGAWIETSCWGCRRWGSVFLSFVGWCVVSLVPFGIMGFGLWDFEGWRLIEPLVRSLNL